MNGLKKQGQARFYINNVFERGIGALLGPITSKGHRYIFAQAKKRGQYFEVGCVDVETGKLVSELGEDNNKDAQTVIDFVRSVNTGE